MPPRDGIGPGKEIPRLGGVRPRPCRPAPAGREQHGAASLDAREMPCRPVPDHDELRTGGERRGSHAAGCRELSLQARTTGQAAGGHRQGLQPSEARRKRVLSRGKLQGAGDVPADQAGRSLGHLRADTRGIRDRQGTYRP